MKFPNVPNVKDTRYVPSVSPHSSKCKTIVYLILGMSWVFHPLFGPLFAVAAQESAPSSSNSAETRFSEHLERNKSDSFLRLRPHLGAIGGFSNLPADRTGPSFGADLGVEVLRPLSAGMSFSVAGPTQDETRLQLLGKVGYHFGGSNPIIRHSFVAMSLGWVRDSVSPAPGVSLSQNYFAVGPSAGFDHPISGYWTVGGEVKYLFNFVSNTSNTLTMIAALKYWL